MQIAVRETVAAGDEVALELLDVWLRAPGTSRSVRRMAKVKDHYEIELVAGGFIFSSVTQETLGGAIRNVLEAARFETL